MKGSSMTISASSALPIVFISYKVKLLPSSSCKIKPVSFGWLFLCADPPPLFLKNYIKNNILKE